MPTNTLGSSNISVFQIKAVADLCGGKFIIDTTPSVFIGTGNQNVLGVRIKIENPYGVEIKSYPTTGYDIVPPMTGAFEINIPKIDGNFDYGNYKITAVIFDAGGKFWEVIQNLDPCAPNKENSTLKTGQINAIIEDNCDLGKVFIKVYEPPTYKGIIAESRTQTYKLTYPSSSLLAPITVTTPSFSVALFQGEYLVTGDLCVTYNKGNNVYYKVAYKVSCSKDVKCLVDTCAVYYKLEQLHEELHGCSDDKKAETSNTIFDTLRLLSTIDWAKKCGQSVSRYILDLEKLLGINCTCSISEGTPIINNTPARDVLINGVNVVKVTNGLTDTYTIDNYSYKVTANPAQNIVSVSAPQLNGAEYVQQLEFDIDNLYTAVKGKVVNFSEYTFWGNSAKKAYVPTAAQLTCMGITLAQYDLLSYADYQSLIWNKLCACCSPCNAVISALTYTKQGGNVVLNWTNTNVYEVDIFLNGIFVDTVQHPIVSYVLNGAANGNTNTAKLIAKCQDGSKGNELEIKFTESGCATIATPTGVNQPPTSDYGCPFNLNTLLTVTAPLGLTYEWHNANNTSTSSIVANPTAVLNGSYFVFLKDNNGCYSLPVQVQVVCRSVSCTAPQNISVTDKFGGINITFESAAFPPPANSYTVSRRLKTDADVPANYTTIGTPTYNSTLGKWEIMDNSATVDTLYIYRAISNCTSTSPFVEAEFARIICPVLTLNPLSTSIEYEFNASNSFTSVIVEYGVAPIVSQSASNNIPPYTNPITGTIAGLNNSTNYVVRLRILIGTFEKICSETTISTLN